MSLNETIIKLIKEKYPELGCDINCPITDRSQKFKCVCNKHGEFETNLAYIRKNKTHICKKCSSELNGINQRKDINLVIAELSTKFPNLIFDKFEYKSRVDKSIVICPKHGEFISSYAYLTDKDCKYGCPYCTNNKIKDPIEDLKNKFPNLDFSKFEYVNNRTEGIIICPDHGEFKASRQKLLHKEVKHACPKCRSLTISIQFTKDPVTVITNMKQLFPQFDYSKFEYKGSRIPSIIICKEHGEFKISYDNFIRKRNKYGCPKCGVNRSPFRLLPLDTVLSDMKSRYPQFDLSKFIYKGNKDKSIAICPTHGEFETSYISFMISNVSPCPYCSGLKVYDPVKYLSDKFPDLDFSKFIFKDVRTKSTVICKTHGEFEANYMALKKSIYGCSKCCNKSYSSYEKEIVEYVKSFYSGNIEENNRNIIKNDNTNSFMELDIYLPDINIAIEFNGKYFHNDENIKLNYPSFNSAKEYHNYKSNKCKEKGIKLIHINELDYINNKNDILENIKYSILNC